MKTILINLIFISNMYAGTFLTNSAAYFSSDSVKVRVASNSDCSNAGTDVAELVEMINPAISQYWNTVTTSRLVLENGGVFETSDANFNTGVLCVENDSDCTTGIIPKVEDIVIACNSENVENFPSSGTIAKTLSNNVSGNNLAGSVIIISNIATSNPFANLSYQQKVAVLSHEIGHAIGIGHTPESSNLMYFQTTAETIRTSLGEEDARAMTYLYPKRFDGCGILSTNDVSSDDSSGFLMSLLIGFLMSFLFIKNKSYQLKKRF